MVPAVAACPPISHSKSTRSSLPPSLPSPFLSVFPHTVNFHSLSCLASLRNQSTLHNPMLGLALETRRSVARGPRVAAVSWGWVAAAPPWSICSLATTVPTLPVGHSVTPGSSKLRECVHTVRLQERQWPEAGEGP